MAGDTEPGDAFVCMHDRQPRWFTDDNDGLLFNDLKELCSLTDGNLSRHLQVLQEAGLVEIWKGFKDKRPQTLCRLTVKGRARFLAYVSVLEDVVGDALKAAKTSRSRRGELPEGWLPA